MANILVETTRDDLDLSGLTDLFQQHEHLKLDYFVNRDKVKFTNYTKFEPVQYNLIESLANQNTLVDMSLLKAIYKIVLTKSARLIRTNLLRFRLTLIT